MEAFNECLINTISVLSQPGDISNLRKVTRTCRELMSLLTLVSGDTHSHQRGAQRQQGSACREAQPRPGGLCHMSGPSISLQHQKSIFPYPLGKHMSFSTSLCFPFLKSGSSNAPRHILSSAAVPGLIPQGSGRSQTVSEGHRLSHWLNFLPTGQWFFLPVATWDVKLVPL